MMKESKYRFEFPTNAYEYWELKTTNMKRREDRIARCYAIIEREVAKEEEKKLPPKVHTREEIEARILKREKLAEKKQMASLKVQQKAVKKKVKTTGSVKLVVIESDSGICLSIFAHP